MTTSPELLPIQRGILITRRSYLMKTSNLFDISMLSVYCKCRPNRPLQVSIENFLIRLKLFWHCIADFRLVPSSAGRHRALRPHLGRRTNAFDRTETGVLARSTWRTFVIRYELNALVSVRFQCTMLISTTWRLTSLSVAWEINYKFT